MKDRNREVCQRAIMQYGIESQLNVAIEEMAELQKEICKFNRGQGDIEHIKEECADVYIMLTQLQMIFDIEIGKEIDRKVTRLEDRLKYKELMK